MQVESLSWFPGHMTKTRRMIAAEIGHMDAVCEILDARIPLASRNPDVDELTAGKPRLVVLNRVDQADPEGTKRWAEHFRAKGYAVLESDAKSGVGTAKFAGAVRELLADKLRAYAEKGMTGRVVRVMILGIPNVGKSTFINKVAGRKTAKTEDRPGVTRSKQWVPIDRNLELLDTPGILWPKFDDQSVGMNLAYTGAVKDDILDVETLGCHLMAYLELNEILVRLFRSIMDVEEKAIITREFQDITNNDMHVIEAIGIGTPKNMSSIAKKLSVTVGTLTIAMNSLVKKGYVKRERGEEDRRVVYISLSDKGKKAFVHHARFHKEMIT